VIGEVSGLRAARDFGKLTSKVAAKPPENSSQFAV